MTSTPDQKPPLNQVNNVTNDGSSYGILIRGTSEGRSDMNRS